MAQNSHAALDWAKHESEIRDLFVSQEKTLREVVAYMREKYNFEASERQYKTRFSKLKNVKAEEWIWFDQEIEYRATLGKNSEPCLHNKPLPPNRVAREIARHKSKARVTKSSNRRPNPSPGRVSVRTPPPTAGVKPGLNLNSRGNLISSPAQFHALQTYFEASSTQQSIFEVAGTEELLHEFDTAMEIEPEIDVNSFYPHSPREQNFSGASDFNYNWPPASSLSPTTITRQVFSFSSSSSSPRPQLEEQGLSPFFQFVNLEVIDARPDFQIMHNLPYFRFQSLLERPEYISLKTHPLLDSVLFLSENDSVIFPAKRRQDALSKLLGIKPELHITENIAQATRKLQRLVPERYEGEFSNKISQIFDARTTGASNLYFIFELAAYCASNNSLGAADRMDTFLKWVIDEKLTDYLEQFLQINTPTIHAFAERILESAIQIKNIKLLTALLDHGVKFDNVLSEIFSIDDMEFTRLVISRVGSICFKGITGVELFHRCIDRNHLDLARLFIQNGVSVDSILYYATPLFRAVSEQDVRMVRFLLSFGADTNLVLNLYDPDTPLGRAASLKNIEIVSLLVDHGARISCKVAGINLLEWSSLECRNIYDLLKEKFGSVAVTVGDLVDAAKKSTHYLKAYISRYEGQISAQQLEKALNESIRLDHIQAAVSLLQYGVSPNCYSLNSRPLCTALSSNNAYQFCEILIKFKANANTPGLLEMAIQHHKDDRFLQLLITSGLNLEEQGMEALVESVIQNDINSAAFLLDSGVDINTPGLQVNPLQMAALESNFEMVDFLCSYGADVNVPAHPNSGRTALQSALMSKDPVDVAGLLLDRGADVFAPPALAGGVTALEAISDNRLFLEENEALCSRLLDAGAPVNRPNGSPSSVLHGVIEAGSEEIFTRILEPQRNAIISHMWCRMGLYDDDDDDDDGIPWEPRTPTQLAASYGELKFVKMLLDRGADVNEAPGYRFGRTALQAATSDEYPNMELVQFLLEKGAHINAKPAVHGGITALQGAAISGDIMVAKLLLEKGAEVNAAPAFVEGRYAIEGAAEHGRLDMIQLLLNAGAKGNIRHKTGFKYAIELAEKNGHFAVANLLKDRKS